MAQARCGCGALVLSLGDATPTVVACHCLDCQRRTGAPFGVGVYYPQNVVEIAGLSRVYVRATASGATLTNHFCPVCGSTVYWFTARHPGRIGVALGALADPTFASPERSVWEQSKHAWVVLDEAAEHFPQSRDV